MRVLVTGATGLIGAAIAARLAGAGHEVIAVARSGSAVARRLTAASRLVLLDIARATTPEHWLPHLQGAEAVVNCAGLLQDGPGQSLRGVQVEGVGALFAACERAGVRRVVHISAMGSDRDPPSAFSQTKAEADASLMLRDVDWVILRPSVVLGRAAYGGSALFRALSALPVLPVVPGTGPLQVVQLDDLVRSVLFFIDPAAPARVAVDVAGPERLSFVDVVLAYRGWLGWRPPLLLPVPGWLAHAGFLIGDALGGLGWRPPVRSTARLEVARGAAGETLAWRRLTGIEPQSLQAALRAEPATVQDRWFARLYLLKALGLAAFSLFWIATGVIALGPGWRAGHELLLAAGLAPPWASAAAMGGAVADIAVGAAVAVRRTSRLGLCAALLVSAIYLATATALVPGLWADPLGPLLKIVPVVILNLFLLAVVDDR